MGTGLRNQSLGVGWRCNGIDPARLPRPQRIQRESGRRLGGEPGFALRLVDREHAHDMSRSFSRGRERLLRPRLRFPARFPNRPLNNRLAPAVALKVFSLTKSAIFRLIIC